jgi:hypothetical protein
MSHVSNLFFVSLCLLCTVRSYRIRRWYYPLVSGLSLGLALNTRPLSALAVTLPFFVHALAPVRSRLVRAKDITLFLAPVLLLLAMFLLYNHVLTGDYLTTGYAKYDPRHGLGFGPDRGEFHFALGGEPRGYTLADAIDKTTTYLIVLSTDLFGWTSLSLLFIVILLLSATKNSWDYVLLFSILLCFTGYFFYWGLGICLGARFFFECIPMFLMLTARGILRVSQIVDTYAAKKMLLKAGTMGQAVGISVLLLCVANFSIYFPSRILLYSNSYWNVNGDIRNQIERENISYALVFVESEYYRKPHSDIDYYNAAFIYNSPDLEGEVVYARDFGAVENARLMAQYPSRDHYLFKRTEKAKGILEKVEPHPAPVATR